MNKKTIITIIAILVIPLLAFWGMSINNNSEATAQTSGLPQIFKFSSSMCLECKQVEQIFDEIMPHYKDKIEYRQIFVDSRKDMNDPLIKKYKVTLVPTVVMVNSDGSVAKTIVGAAEKSEYENCIKGLR